MLQTSWKRWLASPSRVIQPLHWESTKAPQEVMMGLPQSSLSQALRSKGCGSSQVCDFLRSTFLLYQFYFVKPFLNNTSLDQFLVGASFLAVLNFFVQVCLRHSFLQLGLSWLLLLHFISGDKHLLTRSLDHLYHVAISEQCKNHTLLIVSKIWKLV